MGSKVCSTETKNSEVPYFRRNLESADFSLGSVFSPFWRDLEAQNLVKYVFGSLFSRDDLVSGGDGRF